MTRPGVTAEQKARIVAESLFAAVAVESFRPGVPRLDEAVSRFADDGIVGRMHDGRQVGRLLLRAPSLGDVAEDEHDTR